VNEKLTDNAERKLEHYVAFEKAPDRSHGLNEVRALRPRSRKKLRADGFRGEHVGSHRFTTVRCESVSTHHQAELYLAHVQRYSAPGSICINVETSITSTNLTEEQSAHLISSIQDPAGAQISAWTLPAIVVLAVNDIVKEESEERRFELAKTLTAAYRLWCSTEADGHRRRAVFATTSHLLLYGPTSSLLPQDFDRRARKALFEIRASHDFNYYPEICATCNEVLALIVSCATLYSTA
jgi:hypothetical protein